MHPGLQGRGLQCVVEAIFFHHTSIILNFSEFLPFFNLKELNPLNFKHLSFVVVVAVISKCHIFPMSISCLYIIAKQTEASEWHKLLSHLKDSMSLSL